MGQYKIGDVVRLSKEGERTQYVKIESEMDIMLATLCGSNGRLATVEEIASNPVITNDNVEDFE